MRNGWTINHYRFFRVLLGIYLLVHFAHLLPWAAELFSSDGMLADATSSPLLNAFPNLFSLIDAPWLVEVLVASGALAALALAMGRYDRLAALWLFYLLACLFGRNPLIANPSLPYVGWMLLLHVCVPKPRRGSVAADWRLPGALYLAAWVVLAAGYSYSGYTKLLSPAWVSGETVRIVLENPLARDHVWREWLLSTSPLLLQGVTWTVLYVELLFAPLAFWRRARPLLWLTMLLVQFGFLVLLNFADLTFPMLLIHLLTFDPAWVRPLQTKKGTERILYDGECGFCHGFVRFVLAEDRQVVFKFAPLQRMGAQQVAPLAGPEQEESLASLRVLCPDGTVRLRSRAVAHVLERLGGLWRLVALLIYAVPRPVADLGYDTVALIRRRLLPRPAGLCPLLPPALAARFEG
jgi:predicted DCC family thiol-disulfide oxidoreductase YuxK